MTEQKGSFRAVFLFAVFFLFATALLNVVLGFWRHGQGAERRNIHFRRGWIEHVKPPGGRKETALKIVIISNSQGYGREVSDDATYGGLLEKRLPARVGRSVQVLNWSIPAGRGPEFVVLGAAVARVNPDIVLLISSPVNFNRSWMALNNRNGSRINWVSDCYQLIGYADVRGNLPADFLEHFFRPIDYFDILVARAWAPWRYREVAVSWLMLNRELRVFDRSGGQEKWFFRPFQRREGSPLQVRSENAAAEAREMLSSEKISWELLSYYLEAIRSTSARKYYVTMPLHSRSRAKQMELLDVFAEKFTEAGHLVADMSDRIPDKEFITLAHLSEKGHQMMADLMVELLSP